MKISCLSFIYLTKIPLITVVMSIPIIKKEKIQPVVAGDALKYADADNFIENGINSTAPVRNVSR